MGMDVSSFLPDFLLGIIEPVLLVAKLVLEGVGSFQQLGNDDVADGEAFRQVDKDAFGKLFEDNPNTKFALTEKAVSKKHKKRQALDDGWFKVRATTPFVAPVKPMTAPPAQRSTLALTDIDDTARGGEKPTTAPVSRRRDWKGLADNWHSKLQRCLAEPKNLDHVNRLPPMNRTASLPTLHTRFGENYEQLIMDPFEEHVKRSLKFVPPLFPIDSECVDTVREDLKTKALVSDYTSMSNRVRTAPAKIAGML